MGLLITRGQDAHTRTHFGEHLRHFICECTKDPPSIPFPAHSTLCLHLQVKLSRLCEQDNILKDLEARISSLKDDKVHSNS